MKRLVLVLAGLLLVGLVSFRLYQQWPDGAAEAAGPPGGALARSVDVATVEVGTVRQQITLVGPLRAAETVDVTPKTNGRVVAMLVNLGDEVALGQVLARLEDEELQQQVQQSEASLEVSRTMVRQRELELQNQRTMLGRARDLAARGLISAQELEETQNRHDVAEAQLNVAKAQLNQAEAGLRELRIRLEQTRVKAPISGLVGRRFVDVGAFVSSNSPLVTLVKLETVELVAAVPERDMVKLDAGVVGTVHVDALPGRTFQGTVARISPLLDPQTRTAQVEIEIPNPDGALRAEMFARVELELSGSRSVLRVPREALVIRGEREGLYVVDDGTARFRFVTVGMTEESWVEIEEGVEEGELVVTQGANLLNDGDRVRRTDSSPRETSG